MDRDLDEILASQRKMLNRQGEKSKESGEKLKQTFKEHLKKIKTRLKKQDNIEVLYLKYDEVVKNPQTSAQEIIDFLNLPSNSAQKIAAVVDPALYHNRTNY